MGYRSDVKIITTKEGWDMLDKAVKAASDITDDEIKWYLTRNDHCKRICNGKYMLGEWEDIKWYDWGCEDVSTFMKTLGQLDESHIPYNFIRVGEDYEDIEMREGEEYDEHMPSLDLRREIEITYYDEEDQKMSLEDFMRANEDAIMRNQHQLYDEFSAEDSMDEDEE